MLCPYPRGRFACVDVLEIIISWMPSGQFACSVWRPARSRTTRHREGAQRPPVPAKLGTAICLCFVSVRDLTVKCRARSHREASHRRRWHDHENTMPARSKIPIVPVSDRVHDLAEGFIF
jgi:hypothetical protein